MQDRLTSVKTSRNLRNIFLCLSLIFAAEFFLLLYSSLRHGERFVLSSVLFLLAGILTGYLSYYYHARFRNRD